MRCCSSWSVRLWRDIVNLLAARTPEMYSAQFQNPIDVLPWLTEQENAMMKAFDAKDWIYQGWAYERHDVGGTPGFDGSVERALGSIKVPLLYMPSETDLYFPIGDARYEAPFIPKATLMPIPSLWGHTAGAASNPADAKFLNENIVRFLSGR